MFLLQQNLNVWCKKVRKWSSQHLLVSAFIFSFFLHFVFFIVLFLGTYQKRVPLSIAVKSRSDIDSLILFSPIFKHSPLKPQVSRNVSSSLNKKNRHQQNKKVAVASPQKQQRQKHTKTQNTLPNSEIVSPKNKKIVAQSTVNTIVKKSEQRTVLSKKNMTKKISIPPQNETRFKSKKQKINTAVVPVQKEEKIEEIKDNPQPVQNEKITHYDFVHEQVTPQEANKNWHYMKNQFEAYWHPPLGVQEDVHCIYHIFINKQGVIERIILIESSGILMYDIAARAALMKMSFPCYEQNFIFKF
jgi:hypothetical protein